MKKYFSHTFPYLAALFITIFYFCIPTIAKLLATHPTFTYGAGNDINRIANIIQSAFIYPFGKWLKEPFESLIVFPYWLLFFLLARAIYIHTKRFWKIFALTFFVIYILLYFFPNSLLLFENDKKSIANGSVRNGSIENAKRFPFRGKNFSTYSFPGYLLGRTYAHDKVRKTILDAYKICEKTCPDVTFVSGEIGLKNGGRFLPHRTHRNGLSVDIMTPMLKNGKPYRSHHLFNLWGYGIEFDQKGKDGNVEVDYETLAKLLSAIQQSSKSNGLSIQKVIFDPVIRAPLFKTETGKHLKNVPFTRNRVAIRHDDHFHVDFRLK